MTTKHPRTWSPARVRQRAHPAKASGGFSLLEIMIVVSIVLIMLKISLPLINNTMSNLHLGTSSSGLASAIQSARYLAITTGCPVQVTINFARQSGEQTYQLSTEKASGNPPSCGTTYLNIGAQGLDQNGNTIGNTAPVPFASSDISVTSVNGVVLSSSNPTATLQLNPNGVITAAGTTTPPTTFTLVLSQANGGQTNTVNISGMGYVKVTAP